MRIDLSDDIFSAGLESPADYNGVHLEHGAILSRRFDQGRPGVAGEYRPQIREGAGDHATIYLHAGETVFVANGRPKVGDAVAVSEENGVSESWKVRGIKGQKAGIYELLCERGRSRAVTTDKGTVNGGRRLSE